MVEGDVSALEKLLLRSVPPEEELQAVLPGSDRRASGRLSFRRQLDAIYGSRLLVLELDNISEQGFGFSTEIPVPPNSRIIIRLDCYPMDVALEASVIWCRALDHCRYVHGSRFVNLRKEEALLLKGFIAGMRHSFEEDDERQTETIAGSALATEAERPEGGRERK